jgi:hypothetical protein
MEEEDRACQTPKEDLMNDALEHYEEASNAIFHYNSSIPKAIRNYYSEDRKKSKKVFISEEGSKTLVFKYDNKEIKISDLDYDKEVKVSIFGKADKKQVIYLEAEDLISIREHIDYVLEKC